jgi:hypothetical protein
MTVIASPNIVQSGLTLYLDAQNSKSYPGSGSTWYDLSTTGANAVSAGTVTYNSGTGAYMNFNGASFYATDTTKVTVNKTAYTKMAFVKPATFGASNNIIGGGGDQHTMWLQNSNLLQAGHNNSWSIVTAKTPMVLGNWYFCTVSFDSVSGYKLYLNGVVETTSSNTVQFIGSSNDTYVGAYAGGNFYNGNISCAIVYNRALTDAEVLQNFNALRGRYGI